MRGMNGACGASPKPLVPGVPTAVSAGGAGGLPERPREGRGFGVVSEPDFGWRGMGGDIGSSGLMSQPDDDCYAPAPTTNKSPYGSLQR